MFRDDEKEERGVLLFLAVLVALIVASIFGFAVYQSGALKPLVGDAHVIGKEVSGDLSASATAAAGTAAAALAAHTAERVEYDHAADTAHQAQFGAHTHDGDDMSAAADAGVTAEDLKAQHMDAHHADADATVYDHDNDRAHMMIYGEHSHDEAFSGNGESTDSLKAQHMEKYHPRASYDHAADAQHQAKYGKHTHAGEEFVAPDASGMTEEQLREEHLAAFHSDKPGADTTDTVELTDATGAAFTLENGVAKFYFATGKTAVIDGAVDKIGSIVEELKKGGKKAVLSGFVDPRGSAEQNAALAKNRAAAVRDLLLAQGVAEEAIELRKPSDIVPEGTDYAELRRVELVLEDR